MYNIQNQRISTSVNVQPNPYFVIALILTFAPGSVIAQDEGNRNTEVLDEASPVDPMDAAREKGGDILVMKSGVIMSGVQIISSTPLQYEIELLPGMAPMAIPRRQVESVVFDDIDPTRDKRLRAAMPKTEDKLMTGGVKLSPEMEDKLKQSVPGAPLEFKNKDFIQVFKTLSEKTGVKIIVGPALIQLPPAMRLWTIKITPEMKLLEILQKKWAVTFKMGKVTFELDKVVLKKKAPEAKASGA